MPGVRCCVPWPALSAGGPRYVGCEVSSLYHRQAGRGFPAGTRDDGWCRARDRRGCVVFNVPLLRSHLFPVRLHCWRCSMFCCGKGVDVDGSEEAKADMQRLGHSQQALRNVKGAGAMARVARDGSGHEWKQREVSTQQASLTHTQHREKDGQTDRQVDRQTDDKDTDRARRWRMMRRRSRRRRRGGAEKGSASRACVFLSYSRQA